MLTPNDIANKKFDKTFGYGYRTDDVDDFLETIANNTQEMLEEKRDLEKKLEILADKLEEYRQDEDSLRTALLGAQKLGDSVIRESKTKSEIIMRDATIKAETMVDNARRQIEQEQLALGKLQKEVGNFKKRLLALYRQHLELVGALPGGDDEAPAKAAEQNAASAAKEEAVRAPQPAPQQEFVEEREEMEDEFRLNFDDDIQEIEDAVEKDATAEQTGERQDSRFGPLKFGEGFGLNRTDEPPRTSKRKW